MIASGRPGKVVLISSMLGLTGMVGYSQYSPTKFALRGLAECLRQELLPYDISVHIYYVATIDTPGNRAENETKPEITKILEKGDISDPSSASRARTLVSGIERGTFAIASDFFTDLFRASSKGAAPSNKYIVDIILGALGLVVLPIWRTYADRLVYKHNKEK